MVQRRRRNELAEVWDEWASSADDIGIFGFGPEQTLMEFFSLQDDNGSIGDLNEKPGDALIPTKIDFSKVTPKNNGSVPSVEVAERLTKVHEKLTPKNKKALDLFKEVTRQKLAAQKQKNPPITEPPKIGDLPKFSGKVPRYVNQPKPLENSQKSEANNWDEWENAFKLDYMKKKGHLAGYNLTKEYKDAKERMFLKDSPV